MIGLLALSALFSGTEAAIFSLSRLQLHKMEERRDRGSRRVLARLAEPARTLSALLVANNLVNIGLSSLTTAFFLTLISDRARAVEVAFVSVTLAVLFFGEITPKTLAVNFPVSVSRAVSGVLALTCRLAGPVALAFHRMAGFLLRALGFPTEVPVSSQMISRAELRLVLEDADDEPAVMTPSESRFVQNILEFPTRTAEQIMTPRVDVVDLDAGAPPGEIVRQMRATHHSRYPVYEKDPDNVIGFVQAKEYLLAPDQGLRGVLRPVAFFPDAASVDRIFYAIQHARTALVIVVNEYGEMVGLITREDVIEEIVGDIYDEFDLEETPIRKKGEGLFILPGRIPLPDVNEALPVQLPADSAVTLNGFLCEVHGRIPRPGSIVEWHGLRFHVLEVARHQVRKVLLELPRDDGEAG
jgi:CBS domain containing-hemolysin-like protein